MQTPKEQAFLAAKRLVKSSSMWAALVFVVSLFGGILFAYSITKPLKELSGFDP